MFDTLYSQVGVALGSLVIAFAFLQGDRLVRAGAAAWALSLLASLLLQNDSQLYGPQWGLMAVDVAVWPVYAALAWRSRRAWPIWAAALQSLVVMSHVLTLVDFRPPIVAFYAVINLAGYGILLAIALGTAQAWRDHRAGVA